MELLQNRVVRFGVFEADLDARELRKHGLRVKLQDQPFRLLALLPERPGEIVTREEIEEAIWSDGTIIEFPHGINGAVQRIRAALGDDATNPRFIETIPRRGYRFVADVQRPDPAEPEPYVEPTPRRWPVFAALGAVVVAASGWFILQRPPPFDPNAYRLRQLTHDDGITFQPSLSKDGKMIAYASNRDGQDNLDIYVQLISGGSPTRLTDDPADDYQPHFSPTGDRIVFRSQRGDGGVYTVNPLGADPPRLLAAKGYNPQVSPDGRMLAFYRGFKTPQAQLYVMPLEGAAETRIATNLVGARLPIWTPDASHLLVNGWLADANSTGDWWSCPVDGSPAVRTGARARNDPLGLAAPSPHIGTGPVPVPTGWLPGTNDLLFAATAGGDGRLWRMRFNTNYSEAVSNPEPITLGTGTPADVTVADSGVIAFAQIHIGRDIVGLRTGPSEAEPEVLIRDITQSPNAHVSISRDGDRIAYLSRRGGQLDVRVQEISSGRTITVTQTPDEEEGGSFISPDGKLVAFRVGSTVSVAPVDGGPARVLCEECAAPCGWSPDSKKLLLQGRTLKSIDVSSGKITDLFQDGRSPLWHGRVSPDGGWLAFVQPINSGGEPDFTKRRLFVARLDGDSLAPKDNWIAITGGEAPEGWGDWSADGAALYYWLVRDDAFVLYRQSVNAETKHPMGERQEFARFTEFDERLYGQGLAPTLYVSETLIVFPLTKMASNIWLMEPRGNP